MVDRFHEMPLEPGFQTSLAPQSESLRVIVGHSQLVSALSQKPTAGGDALSRQQPDGRRTALPCARSRCYRAGAPGSERVSGRFRGPPLASPPDRRSRTKMSKMRGRISAPMPMPSSVTSTSTSSLPCLRARNRRCTGDRTFDRVNCSCGLPRVDAAIAVSAHVYSRRRARAADESARPTMPCRPPVLHRRLVARRSRKME